MPADNSSNPSWSSRPAFYLASIGAAVGLGSIWRLPYLVGSSGGSAFIVVFVLACLLIATPLLVAEFAIGRRSQRCPADAAGIVARESGLGAGWNAIGVIGTIAVFAVMSYYTVVAGWVLAYTWKCASGALAGQSRADIAALWQGFLANPIEIGAWHLMFLLMVAFISARGVGRGIEVATKVRAPVLLLLLIILATYALMTGDVRQGLGFAFAPDLKAITPQVVLAAVGQAFFATGVGLAMMLAYGAYVSKGTSLVRSALAVTGSILLVSLLATLTIFPLVFQYGMDPAQGPELVFDVLATVFSEMPGGRLFGTLFFVLLVFAALTPSLAGMEPVVAWLQQHWQMARARAVAVTIGLAWVLGIGTVLSFNAWSGWHPLGFVPVFADKTFFDVLDYVSANILPPIGALLTSVLVGWRLSRAIVNEELAETTPFARRVCVWLLRYVCPIAITTMLISALASASPVEESAATDPAAKNTAGAAPVTLAQTAAPAIRTEWITMPDGVRLSVDLYVPQDMQPEKHYPVLLEYLPYRKMESRSGRFGFYSYFVAQGYVVARVDIRGTGESEGKLIAYEYTEQEQADGEVVIDWLSKQNWSNGKVGMFGISWGGFNSIQMAMRNPPALKAIIAVDATDDIYEDDVHFTDGIMHADSYEMRQDIENAIPGAPAYLIDDAYFANRFDTEPWFLVYKRQQRDGPFWDRASLIGRYESIRVPTYVVGGWYDGYRDSIPRMLQHVQAPVKALLGPWSHTWPNEPFPGAGFEWRADAVRWFDHWLKDADNGIMQEPAFTVFIREWHPPGLKVTEIPGHWRSEAGWPLAGAKNEVLYLQADHVLATATPQAASHQLLYKPDVGIEAAGSVMWWGDLQEDQRAVDAFSLVYETPPLQQAVTILGFPAVSLRASTDAPLAHWIARLSNVAPDGRVTLITGAALNGAHRNSAEHPEALVPGETVDLDIEMHFTSWVFPAGHRIRLAVNNAMWPMFWPTPYAMNTRLELGGESASKLVLPLLPPATLPPPEFSQATTVDPSPPGFGESTAETESGYAEISRVTHDFRADTTRLIATNSGTTAYPWGQERYSDYLEHFVNVADPAHAGVNSEYSNEVVLDDRVLKWTGLFDFTSDAGFFYYRYTRRLEQDGQIIREKHWEEAIPRDFN